MVNIEIFENILEIASMFVGIKCKKIDDGKYVLEGLSNVIKPLVKKFANGTLAITSAIGKCSSAVVKIKDMAIVNINNVTWNDVMIIVN